ncbi:MAG: VCBS repeat-containing protein [Candidatus Marinimicrobia bacterium]|jgi:hypothetical protein|nr:VCBS repeat-containing protein [Candidatus Neomarinimicrobiota bacterium]MBT4593582.1 VCBS repeat-containing protein [Candidatus Neomarinimicrobiota bacterium]MBT5404850.1 VCBS repeat-containing protein [Candidatus Neomarinimicrobiota bacterium]
MSFQKIPLFILLALHLSFGQSQKLIHLDGTYDLDGDKWLEFIALGLNPVDEYFPSTVEYYELDEDGYQVKKWEFSPPSEMDGYFVNAMIGDIQGDGFPDLITVMNLSRLGDNASPHVFIAVYDWNGETFSELPIATLDIGKQGQSLRCNNFALLDMDADGVQEIVLALGSPFRGFAFVGMDENTHLSVIKKIRPNDLLVGSGLLYAGVVDYDSDGYDDLIAISPEGNVLKAQAFYNVGGVFDAGALIKKTYQGLSNINHRSMVLSDWDADGFQDLVIPFGSGDMLALTLTPAALAFDRLPISGGPLSQIITEDFDQDTYSDLLILSSTLNQISFYSGKSGRLDELSTSITETSESFQISTMIPLVQQGNYTGQILASGWNGNENVIYAVNIGEKSESFEQGFIISAEFIANQLPEMLSNTQEEETQLPDVFAETYQDRTPESPQQEIEIITDLGETPKKNIPAALEPGESKISVLKEQPQSSAPKKISRTLETPKQPKPIETVGQRLPKHILPRYVLSPNEQFVYELPRKSNEEFHSFRWERPPPKGMFFHYETRSIRWVPTNEQLDAFPISFHVKMKVNEIVEPDINDGNQVEAYKVVPVLEARDEEMWIYVNDPPQFLSSPVDTEFVAGAVFTYQALVRDLNKDAKLQFVLENAPKGMMLNEDILSWKTDSSHVDVYDIRLVVSDGFDRKANEFKLFARAGIKILSNAPAEAQVGEPYTYPIKIWRQQKEKTVQYKLLKSPDGMTMDKRGLVSWTPNPVQVDTIPYTVMVSHGVATDTQFVNLFVNHPPIIRKAPPPMNLINLGDTWDFQIEVDDPNKTDQLVYTAHVLPEGMRMDPYLGRLRWDPTKDNLDFSKLKIEISDGHESRTIESEFFVNAPTNIVSIPPMSATVGEEYKYSVMLVDENKGALLPFDRLVKIDDVSQIRIYSINISDDVYLENIHRYISDWQNAEAIYQLNKDYPADTLLSRLNLKKYTHSVFFENNRLYTILETIDDRTIKMKDFLWEFFQGNKGKPPRLVVEKLSPFKYTLSEFPEGMEVDERTGTISWTPTKDQVDKQKITFIASDGYSRDEQSYEIYSNHLPTIVSNPARMGLVGELYKYQVRVEDRNENANLEYTLLRGPHGMQMDKYGRILWVPKAAQINYSSFEVQVSDGYGKDIQTGKMYINMPPTLLSIPKPVGLTGHTWRYKLVAEDLNSDKISFRPVRLPKYARYNKKKNLVTWAPKKNQMGANDFIFMAIDERGATTAHEFQVHVFYDPSAKQLINTGWPLMLTFVGVVFAWGMAQI